VKTGADVEKATQILTESLRRIREALAKGEPTGYFSGDKDSSATLRGNKDRDVPGEV
jgi:hypothetical protein